MIQSGASLPSLDEVGFSEYSEFDEDGILLFIFSVIGHTNKILVDIGAGSIQGSNVANLLIHHGWTGTLIDGSCEHRDSSKLFYDSINETKHYPPNIIQEWVTAQNVSALLQSVGHNGTVDLLSLDIDGVDYWVLKELECIQPRVIVLEYQCIWGSERSVSVPYDPNFRGIFEDGYGIYSGASLMAFVKLLKAKGSYGYRLVGCNKYGFNAFFIRNDIGMEEFPEIETSKCFKHPFTHWAQKTFLQKMENLPWEEV